MLFGVRPYLQVEQEQRLILFPMELAIGSMVDAVAMMIWIEFWFFSSLFLSGSGWETLRESYLLSSSMRLLGMNINMLCTFVQRFCVAGAVVSTEENANVS